MIKFIRELIGQGQRIVRKFEVRFRLSSRQSVSQDIGNVAYDYWDRAYHAKVEGLELSGLLIKPLVNKIAAWALGTPPRVELGNREKNKFVARWLETNLNQLIKGYKSSLKLGDGYIFINPDLTLSVISPQNVFPIVDPNDFSSIIGWTIVREFKNPIDLNSVQMIKEVLTHEKGRYFRVRTITDERDNELSREVFSLPLRQIPLFHISNNPSENERFGRPEAEMLVELLHRYGEAIDAALDGNLRQGRPTPVFSGLGSSKELDAFWTRHSTRVNRELDDGTTETYDVIDFDADRAVTLGGDAKFSWASPGSASSDTETLLGILFYLYVQHSEMPEWVLGNAITGSRASAEVQVDPLVRFITMKRLDIEMWFKPLISTLIEMKSLSELKFQSSTKEEEKMDIIWPILTRKDGQLTLQAVQWSYAQRLIDRETAISHLPLDITDPEEVLDQALDEERPELAIQNDASQDKSGKIDKDDTSNNKNGNKNGPIKQKTRS